MSGSLRQFPVPSVIQGISQQAPQAVKQSSAKDQQNCVNDLLLGSRARNGSTLKAFWPGERVDPFSHRIERDEGEDYKVMITDGLLEVINLVDGTKATITGDISAYLATTGEPREAFSAATVEDTTFIANAEILPAMGTTKSPVRNNWAMAHFKSANYSTDYKLHIRIGGTTFTASYKTPDNSTAANADFIATNRLAKEFTDALNSTATSPAGFLKQLNDAGYTGFSATQYGSTILIDGGTNDFSISTEDGLGGEQFISFKERVKEVADLPLSSVDGYVVAVGTKDEDNSFDYYLKYEGPEQDGKWVEVVAPDTPIGLDADTLPHVLVNTAKNTFEVRPATWGARLAGDGINTAQDPEFIGRPIVDLQFLDSRLAITTEASFELSRSRNAYVFFPDTVQTELDTAPISSLIVNGKVTIVRKTVVMGKRLQFWANKIQSQLDSGDSPLTANTAENLPTTAYEYDGRVAPIPQGLSSLIFGTKRGRWNSLTEIIYRGDTAVGEIKLTGHCAKLIDGRLVGISAGDTANMTLVWTNQPEARLYVYQFFNDGDQRAQSAWNYWTWPAAERVLWAGISGSTVYAILSWGSAGHSLETIETEYDGDEVGEVPLRADHRVSEDLVTAEGDGYRTLTLPYPVPEAKRAHFVAYQRVDDAATGEQRGVEMPLWWQSDTEVRVVSTIPEVRFHFGAKVVARRTLPQLYIEDRNGVTMHLDRVNIVNLVVSHTNSSYYRVELGLSSVPDPTNGVFNARRLGDPSIRNDQIALETSGTFSTRINDQSDSVAITLVNDSIFPSSWESLKYEYTATSRAKI